MAWLALTSRVATVHSRDRVSGDLQSCSVVPQMRGRGIGGRLVRAVLATATERGAEHVTVHTSAESPAMDERDGFRPSARLLWAEGEVAERWAGPSRARHLRVTSGA
ncbi:GNAT family N-acetyltransferase [Agrococcus sp. SGAir0287]|uniref:GNAT family N-acetyltransferase n=1 Tax=Agrococcus sp. SGAir0287 TaxID=2070347 RepID=UPI0020C81F46|nr:GNAT family N-acetyltransferase [Agrococcus sp. SGAir0287]